MRYLSIPDHDEDGKRLLKKALMVNAKVEHQEGRHETGDKGTIYFRFRPMHGVRSSEDLLMFLQQQTTAQGILVRELRDGWAGCLQSINELESEGKVLVLRNKKEGTPRMVWLNDPSLNHEVDNEFKDLWHQVQVPKGAADLRNSLLEFGLTPTSNVTAPAPVRKQEKKRKPARRGGKTTNTPLIEYDEPPGLYPRARGHECIGRRTRMRLV